MEKQDIESILIANCYLTHCKLSDPCKNKIEIAKRFLIKKIRKALENKLRLNPDGSDSKAFVY